MTRNTVAIIGAALGAVGAKMLYEKINPDEEVSLSVYLAGGAVGLAAGYHLAANNLSMMQAINNGSTGTGKVGKEAIALLEKINPNDLYRDEMTSEVKIGLVYPNEKTVGTF